MIRRSLRGASTRCAERLAAAATCCRFCAPRSRTAVRWVRCAPRCATCSAPTSRATDRRSRPLVCNAQNCGRTSSPTGELRIMTEQEATLPEHQASRTLVKSPPELWLACSVQESLARHLQSFGEIRITRLEPETAVAWEGDTTSGTVRIEPSGWGTRVTLTARPLAAAQTAEAVQETTSDAASGHGPGGDGARAAGVERWSQPQPEPEPLEPPAAARGGLWQRLMARLRPASQGRTGRGPARSDPILP